MIGKKKKSQKAKPVLKMINQKTGFEENHLNRSLEFKALGIPSEPFTVKDDFNKDILITEIKLVYGSDNKIMAYTYDEK